MRYHKKEEQPKKKPAFTHVHVRSEGMLADEATEQQVAHDVDDIEKGLRAIYKGDHADLATVTRSPGGFTRMLGRIILVLFLLLLGLGGAYGGWAWWENRNSSDEAVVVEVFVPSAVRSGEEVTVEISYQNPRSIALAQLSLDVNLPPGFQPSTLVPAPTNEEQLVWNVGTLGQHSDGKITLTGMWYGNVPDDDRIQIVTTYRPANFNADFSSITSADVAVHESVLTATLTGPEKATVGEAVTYTATFTNTGALAQHAEAEFILPSGFIPQVWNPPLPAGQGTAWSLGTLVPGALITQTVQGAYASEVQDLQEMNVQSFLKSNEEKSYTQGKTTWLTNVQGGALSVALAGNGSSSTLSVVPGDQLRLSVQLANISAAAVSDAQVRLDFQPESGIPLVWKSANVGKAKITAQGVILSAADIGTLAPAERKTYSFLFPLEDVLASGSVSAFTVTAYVTSGGVTVQSLPLSVSVNASVSLGSSARYYDESGALLGSGTFPPKVGEETTFVLTWSFTRALHAVHDVTITATLPQNVRFNAIRNTSTGSVAYDDASRVLTWNISEIPDDVTSGAAQIEITYTPSDADVDTYGKLISDALFRGIDTQTQAVLTARAGALTTEMPDDTIAAGKGLVGD